MHQMSLWEFPLKDRGEAPNVQRSGETGRAGHGKERSGTEHSQLMERVVARENALQALKRVRRNKGTVARVWDRKFLGYSFWVAAGRRVKLRVTPKALEEMKQRIRQITSRSGGRSMERVTGELGAYLRGWKEYFKLSNTPGVFFDLDHWIHRRLRAVQLKQWKRGTTVYRELRRRGVPEWLAPRAALFARNWWRVAGHGALHTALPGSYFERLGVPRLAANTSTH
jgi:hypothetical protein